MNSITVAGSLGRDAELKYLNNGDAISAFSVADSQGKDKNAIWWNCTIYGKRAESLNQYLVKGQAVTVVGHITEREYTDKNGNERKAMEIRVTDVMLQGRKQDAAPKPVKQEKADYDDSDVPF